MRLVYDATGRKWFKHGESGGNRSEGPAYAAVASLARPHQKSVHFRTLPVSLQA
ncbi:MAG TPA: hypothetical protein PLU64_17735 [Saprospiraceae bacterium]|nr:hypothetical protein [Saprospiraceae bacterium]